MNKKSICTLVYALAGLLWCGSCSDFLDETPNKSGSAYIYHMDQLYGLMGSPDLYFFSSAGADDLASGLVGTYMNEQFLLSDVVEYSPEYYSLGMWAADPYSYDNYCWTGTQLTTELTMNDTWQPAWERIYRFNTVLENLDKVTQSTDAIRQQVEGEARFGRAYYHFMLLTQYCLWQEDAPGIGYRDNTEPQSIPERQTVGYTLGRIYEDLQLAEDALTRAGRTEFDFARNTRPTVPTLQAFRARVELYRGNYKEALQDAEAALQAHHTLVDFKTDPEYALEDMDDIYLLDETGTKITETLTMQTLMQVYDRGAEKVAEYQELYLPHMSVLYGTYPLSEWYYNLWDRENDARWHYFYATNYETVAYAFDIATPAEVNGEMLPMCITWDKQQWLKPWHYHSYTRFNCNGWAVILGMTTAEMYLVKAECEARLGNAQAAAEALKTLRRTRFMNGEAADNIGGSIDEVLDERSRELGIAWRFFDIKRLNGAENAGIYIRRDILADPNDLNTVTTLEIVPDDPRWALPFYPAEAANMGWEQNPGWE